MTLAAANHLDPSTSSDAPRKRLPRRDPTYRLITELAEPGTHRTNLWALANQTAPCGRKPNLDAYRLIRRYLAENFEVDIKRDMRETLVAVFGVFAGNWLYGAAKHRSYPRQEFMDRLASFIDTQSTTAMPPIRTSTGDVIPGYVPPVLPLGITTADEYAAMNEAERLEARLYERDLQFANRTQLAVLLIQREGLINPRLFANRWLREQNLVTRYARTPHRFTTHFGLRASSLLDTTEPTERRALADTLRSIR
jgi:hypothetical protein